MSEELKSAAQELLEMNIREELEKLIGTPLKVDALVDAALDGYAKTISDSATVKRGPNNTIEFTVPRAFLPPETSR
jgi:hypothetical protein